MPGALVVAVRLSNILLRSLGLERLYATPPADRPITRKRVMAIQRLGPKLPGWLSSGIDRRLARSVEQLVGHRYAESNRRTQEMTGLDLKSLGYDVAD